MPSFHDSAETDAAPLQVWKLLYDPARFPQWWAGVGTVDPMMDRRPFPGGQPYDQGEPPPRALGSACLKVLQPPIGKRPIRRPRTARRLVALGAGVFFDPGIHMVRALVVNSWAARLKTAVRSWVFARSAR